MACKFAPYAQEEGAPPRRRARSGMARIDRKQRGPGDHLVRMCQPASVMQVFPDALAHCGPTWGLAMRTGNWH
jgi:hypothetical protein